MSAEQRLNRLRQLLSSKRDDVFLIRSFYNQLLLDYPTSNLIWTMCIKWELGQQHIQHAQSLFQRALPLNPTSVDLWRLYLQLVHLLNQEHSVVSDQRLALTQAYEYALKHVGLDIQSTGIWMDYLRFIQRWECTNTLEVGHKIEAQRRTFHRALSIPLENIEQIWKEYDQFENELNRLTAKKFLSEKSPVYMTARSTVRELRVLREPIARIVMPRPVDLVPLPVGKSVDGVQKMEYTSPPSYHTQSQYFHRLIEYEKSNPMHYDDQGSVDDRVVYVMREWICGSGRFMPEAWCTSIDYLLSVKRRDMALEFLHEAMECLPRSLLLFFYAAEWAESEMGTNGARQTDSPKPASTTTATTAAVAPTTTEPVTDESTATPTEGESTVTADTANPPKKPTIPHLPKEYYDRLSENLESYISTELEPKYKKLSEWMARVNVDLVGGRNVGAGSSSDEDDVEEMVAMAMDEDEDMLGDRSSEMNMSLNEGVSGGGAAQQDEVSSVISSSTINTTSLKGKLKKGTTSGGSPESKQPLSRSKIRSKEDRAKLIEKRKEEYARLKWEMEQCVDGLNLCWIQHMKYARRTEGMKSSRLLFSRFRKSTLASSSLFTASALMEYYCNKDASVAFKIFEVGMKMFASEKAFVRAYAELLIRANDETNLRALFERTAGTPTPTASALEESEHFEKWRSLWIEYLTFENDFGDLPSVKSLESRFLQQQSIADYVQRRLGAASAKQEKSTLNAAKHTLSGMQGSDIKVSSADKIRWMARRFCFGDLKTVMVRDLGLPTAQLSAFGFLDEETVLAIGNAAGSSTSGGVGIGATGVASISHLPGMTGHTEEEPDTQYTVETVILPTTKEEELLNPPRKKALSTVATHQFIKPNLEKFFATWKPDPEAMKERERLRAERASEQQQQQQQQQPPPMDRSKPTPLPAQQSSSSYPPPQPPSSSTGPSPAMAKQMLSQFIAQLPPASKFSGPRIPVDDIMNLIRTTPVTNPLQQPQPPPSAATASIPMPHAAMMPMGMPGAYPGMPMGYPMGGGAYPMPGQPMPYPAGYPPPGMPGMHAGYPPSSTSSRGGDSWDGRDSRDWERGDGRRGHQPPKRPRRN